MRSMTQTTTQIPIQKTIRTATRTVLFARRPATADERTAPMVANRSESRSADRRQAATPHTVAPTPTESWLLALGLEATEVERCPVADCDVCARPLHRAA